MINLSTSCQSVIYLLCCPLDIPPEANWLIIRGKNRLLVTSALYQNAKSVWNITGTLCWLNRIILKRATFHQAYIISHDFYWPVFWLKSEAGQAERWKEVRILVTSSLPKTGPFVWMVPFTKSLLRSENYPLNPGGCLHSSIRSSDERLHFYNLLWFRSVFYHMYGVSSGIRTQRLMYLCESLIVSINIPCATSILHNAKPFSKICSDHSWNGNLNYFHGIFLCLH